MMMGEIDEVIGVAGHHIPRMEGESWSRMLLKLRAAPLNFNLPERRSLAAPADMF